LMKTSQIFRALSETQHSHSPDVRVANS
jgi:hypothetical protein